jgi:hypothetical protein
VRELRPRRQLLPVWDMPSDPVKAVFWFLHWLLQVLVRYFYLLIAVGALVEAVLNGIVGFAGTALVGLLVWGGLAVLLLFVNVATGVSHVVSDVNRVAKGFPPRNTPFSNFREQVRDEPGGRVVEGTITDLEEERRKRRQE